MNRDEIDTAIRNLWHLLRDASDEPDSLTEQDMAVWEAATKHEAVQGPLRRAMEASHDH